MSANARSLRYSDQLDAGRPGEMGPLLTACYAGISDDFRLTSAQLDVTFDTALAEGVPGTRMTSCGFGASMLARIW